MPVFQDDAGVVRPIRVALIDDQRLIVEMTRFILEDAGITVMGIAYRLDEISALLALEPADVALVDHALPDGRGTDAIYRIRYRWPRCRVILLTSNDDLDIARDAVAAGADGIVLKNVHVDQLLGVIRKAAAGKVLLSPAYLAGLMVGTGPRIGTGDVALTERERDILEVLLQVGDIETATRLLGITESTYRVHLHHAMRKLGVGSRLEAISLALRLGIIRAPTTTVLTSSTSDRPGDSRSVRGAGRNA